MPVNAEVVYKDRDTIVAELITAWQARVPDVTVTVDSVIRMWVEVWATVMEGQMLANQLLHDDMFPQTATALALQRYGDVHGRLMKGGTTALGTLRFGGAGGTSIPLGTLASAQVSTEDALRFATTVAANIPNPGTPSAPTIADGGVGIKTGGTYEYAITFQTALGETALGAVSNALVLGASRQISITGIPLGGPGTIARNLYRRLDGGAWQKHVDATIVAALNNNTTTSVVDNYTVTGGAPLTDSTAEQVDVAAAAEDVGSEYNVLAGTVTIVNEAQQGIASVTNPSAFTGGSDPEDIEEFRSAVMEWMRNPQSGGPDDLKTWAESIDGVDTATVFPNDNLGTPTNGHVTVRISGPNATVPLTAVQTAVYDYLVSKDLANITIHVSTFTPKTINVTVTTTRQSGYALADVTTSVQAAIADYINSLPVGGTVYSAGITDAVFGLPGIATVVVNSPSDTTSLATEKPVIGTITVS